MSSIPTAPAPATKWKYLLSIKPILIADEPLWKKAHLINMLMLSLPSRDSHLYVILMQLTRGADLSKAEFNVALDLLYDWADKNSVWLGVSSEDPMQDS